MYTEYLSAHFEQVVEKGYMQHTGDYEADVQAGMLQEADVEQWSCGSYPVCRVLPYSPYCGKE